MMKRNIKAALKRILPHSILRMIATYRRFHKFRPMYKSNKEKIGQVLDSLEDDVSKETLLAYMKLCTKGSVEELLHLTKSKKDQYFDEAIIQLGSNEVFVDMGVYDGATSLEFARRVGHKYAGILLFEPDSKSFAASKENIKHLRDAVIWNEACYDQNRTICFQDTGGGAHVF